MKELHRVHMFHLFICVLHNMSLSVLTKLSSQFGVSSVDVYDKLTKHHFYDEND